MSAPKRYRIECAVEENSARMNPYPSNIAQGMFNVLLDQLIARRDFTLEVTVEVGFSKSSVKPQIFLYNCVYH